jgi:hypothetical protein
MHLKMPSGEQKQATAARMMQKYQLPWFGMMVRGFDSAPHDFPETIGLQDFNCRKNFYALNCQVPIHQVIW